MAVNKPLRPMPSAAKAAPSSFPRGDLRRRDAASGNASRKPVRTPIPNLQTMQHVLADDRSEDAAENCQRSG